jgi:hypothetical protein
MNPMKTKGNQLKPIEKIEISGKQKKPNEAN